MGALSLAASARAWAPAAGGGAARLSKGCRRASAALLQTAETLLRGCCITALPARLDSGCHRAARARLGKATRAWVLWHLVHRSPSVGAVLFRRSHRRAAQRDPG